MKIVYCFLGLFWFAQTFAQENNYQVRERFSDNLFIKADINYGFIFDHRSTMGFVLKKYVHASEITLMKKTYGAKPTDQFYNFPMYGFGLYYANLQNNNVLGYVLAPHAFYAFPLFRGNKTIINFKIGLGLGYVSKKFDVDNNYYNSLISTTLNGFYQFKFDFIFFNDKPMNLLTGAGITHLSNGAVNLPNLGLNLPSYYLGLAYRLGPERQIISSKIADYKRNNSFELLFSAGLREVYITNEPKNKVYTTEFNYNRHLNNKHKLILGIDLFYDQSLYYSFEKNKVFNYQKSWFFYSGIHAGYGLKVNKVSIIIENGFYTFTKAKQLSIIYQRLGLRYYLGKHVMANVSFKTYFAVAEFVEWGIGYQW